MMPTRPIVPLWVVWLNCLVLGVIGTASGLFLLVGFYGMFS